MDEPNQEKETIRGYCKNNNSKKTLNNLSTGTKVVLLTSSLWFVEFSTYMIHDYVQCTFNVQCTTYIPSVQFLPAYPSAHVHLYLATPCVHVALFAHGSYSVHSFMSI